jgi:hypothetical protein
MRRHPTNTGKAAPSFLKVVAGTDHGAIEPAPRKQKLRKMYKQREPIEYQDGLPIDPAGEMDKIFHDIAKHREAAAHFDHCVNIQSDAEGKVSDDEFFYIRHNTSNACDMMMMCGRAVINCRPSTRRGLIHQARYLAAQFDQNGECVHLPETMNEQPWPHAFLRALAGGLRKMAGEFP